MSRITITGTTSSSSSPVFQAGNAETHQSAPASEVPNPHTWLVEEAGNEGLMEQLRWLLEDFLSYPLPPYTKKAEKIEAALKKWGTAAFQALFSSPEACRWIPDNQAESFDLIITLDDPAQLAWPWEALHSPLTGFLGQKARIQRRMNSQVPSPDPISPKLTQDFIRILLVTSRPYKDQDVPFRSISRPLVDMVREQELPASIEVLRPATFENLRDHLKNNPHHYHILHFDGHGGYDQEQQSSDSVDRNFYRGREGKLLFENKDGTPDPIEASRLSSLLAGNGVPFAVLNACRSGKSDEEAHEGTAFASVAGALVKAGFHGVLAMSHNLTVSGANQFIPAFYQDLFSSGNLLDAAREGRKKMVEQPQRSDFNPKATFPDWLLPVVYQQRDDYNLSFASQASPPKVSFNLPEDERAQTRAHEFFVGRDSALHFLERQLVKDAPAVILHGLGGIGKTTLARHFLQWLRDTGGLELPPLWISFDGIKNVTSELNQFGRALFGQIQFDSENPEHLSQLVTVFRKHRGLIVWDNFESVKDEAHGNRLPEKDAQKLQDFLTTLHGGKTLVLITSRTEERWLSNCKRYHLPGLKGGELFDYAAHLLTDLDLSLDRSNSDFVALLRDDLAGHPILIRSILTQIGSQSPVAIRQQVQTNLSELIAARPLGTPPDQEQDRLIATLSVLKNELPTAQGDILPAVALHERFIDLDEIHLMGEKSSHMEEYDRSSAETLFQNLSSAGLLSPIGENIFSVHPLLTSFLRSSIAPIPEQWTRAFTDYMGSLADYLTQKELHEQRPQFFKHRVNFLHALDLAEKLKMDTHFTALTQSLASWAFNNRDFPEAKRLFTQLSESSDSQSQAAALHQLGRIAEEERDFSQAREWHLKSLAIEEAQGNQHGMASSYHQLGIVAQEERDFPQAREWYLKSLAIAEAQGNQHGMASSYHQLGRVAEEERDFPQAREWYLKSLAIKEAQGNQHGMASSYHQLGRVAQEERDFPQAREWYLKSLAIFEAQGNQHGMASSYHQLGIVAQEERDFPQAREWYLKSLAIFEAQGNQHGMASSYHQLGIVAEEERDFSQAREWHLKSLAIKETQRNQHGMAYSYHQLGRVAQEERDFPQAREWYLKSLAIFEAQGNQHGMASSYHQLGRVAEKTDQVEEAADWALKAFPILAESDPHNAKKTLGTLARLLSTASPESATIVRKKMATVLPDEIIQVFEKAASDKE